MNISTIDHETLREVVRKSRRQTWLAKHRWLALFVGLPTVLATIYYGFIASPIYVSQSVFVIKSPGQKGAFRRTGADEGGPSIYQVAQRSSRPGGPDRRQSSILEARRRLPQPFSTAVR